MSSSLDAILITHILYRDVELLVYNSVKYILAALFSSAENTLLLDILLLHCFVPGMSSVHGVVLIHSLPPIFLIFPCSKFVYINVFIEVENLILLEILVQV
jgi:hypothetical protein